MRIDINFMAIRKGLKHSNLECFMSIRMNIETAYNLPIVAKPLYSYLAYRYMYTVTGCLYFQSIFSKKQKAP